MDLSQGFAAYADACNAMKTEQRKVRRIEREIGPLRFVAHSDGRRPIRGSPRVEVATVPRQRASGPLGAGVGSRDGRKTPADGRGRVLGNPFPALCGRALGGRPLRALARRRCGTIGFPPTMSRCRRYSPGLILLMRMAEHAPALGIRMIDLGGGTSLYKERFMTGSVMVAAGSIECPSFVALRRRTRRSVKALVERSPWGAPARRLMRACAVNGRADSRVPGSTGRRAGARPPAVERMRQRRAF